MIRSKPSTVWWKSRHTPRKRRNWAMVKCETMFRNNSVGRLVIGECLWDISVRCRADASELLTWRPTRLLPWSLVKLLYRWVAQLGSPTTNSSCWGPGSDAIEENKDGDLIVHSQQACVWWSKKLQALWTKRCGVEEVRTFPDVGKEGVISSQSNGLGLKLNISNAMESCCYITLFGGCERQRAITGNRLALAAVGSCQLRATQEIHCQSLIFAQKHLLILRLSWPDGPSASSVQKDVGVLLLPIVRRIPIVSVLGPLFSSVFNCAISLGFGHSICNIFIYSGGAMF